MDVIILSNGKSQPLIETTQQAIDTCHFSEVFIKFNILVIEQQDVVYKNCKTIKLNDEFNYNAFLNYGLSQTQGEYVALCNNDLIFHKHWANNIMSAMIAHNVFSASPLCPHRQGRQFPGHMNVEFGYNNGQHLSGWCIVINRKLLSIIGELRANFPFWFADNEYAEQLKENKVSHILVRDSIVRHLSSATLNTLDKHDGLTTDNIQRFIEMYPDNESAQYFKKHL